MLVTFIYNNLPALMDPTSTVVIVDNGTAIPTTNTIVVSPGDLQALKTAVLNNFNQLGLPADIQEIVQQFFALNPSVQTIE
ncbi:hypothetical protein [Sporomusa acidovorans]|uniref:hypothetical protein n=1 Tax=Sporomusa acidovorans TaxID=112900 RepID=UPI0015A1FDEA|nr:hypothetical protein [Sporomusa acidovorans]